ncbi:hypothetical protein LIER_21591 [Lithospermum erythrorhizon]|uniref:Uncharacterized protein n=1 Tax=Lithospermum erythrorhizon TaxID=34254 RepID=A0AAV3QTP9_LITER
MLDECGTREKRRRKLEEAGDGATGVEGTRADLGVELKGLEFSTGNLYKEDEGVSSKNFGHTQGEQGLRTVGVNDDFDSRMEVADPNRTQSLK